MAAGPVSGATTLSQPVPVADQLSTTTSHESDKKAFQPSTSRRIWTRLNWCPPMARWDPENPPIFTHAMNLLFAFACTFTVANLYYSHPILNILADSFDVPYVKVSQIPTLAQAGYAIGLFFVCPLGDLLPRRPLVLWLVLITAAMSIALAITKSVNVFIGIQFITGITTVSPQLMMPLAGDIAPPHRRAAAMSIIFSGMLLGVLMARLIAGVMAQYTSWRNIYWMSSACQFLVYGSLWSYMPDYPAMNKGLNYFKILWSVPVIVCRNAIVVQICLIAFFGSAVFTNFWTVLTFLLAGEPYNFDPVKVGLFALIGVAPLFFGPFYARLVIDRFVPLFSIINGLLCTLIATVIGTYVGRFNLAGPILQAIFIDLGMSMCNIANRTALMGVEPLARNRINTAFMLSTYVGQLMGTSVSTQLFVRYGWYGSGSFGVACTLVTLLVAIARGPYEDGWIGWHGGWTIRKKSKDTPDGRLPKTEGEDPGSNTSEKDSIVGKHSEEVDLEGALTCTEKNNDLREQVHEMSAAEHIASPVGLENKK